MLRPSLVSCSRLLIATAVVFSGCAEELDLEAPPILPGEEGGPVEAQFDPTNPIPVLTLIPVPTVLAQNPDGTLNQEAVAPAACEIPTDSQCLQFVSGWPTTTPITLFFSDEIDLATIDEGIELYEVEVIDEDTRVLTAVALDVDNATLVARAPPGPNLEVDPTATATACNEQFGYDTVPPSYEGFDLEVSPATPLAPATQYIVLVKSDEQGGLRDTNGDPIQPSGLFFLLNTDEPPIAEDGEILSALLRSQVQGTILEAQFGGRLLEDLSTEERMQLDAAVRASGENLAPLYTVFDGIVQVAAANQVLTDRRELVFANTWNTAGPPEPGPVFDPQAGAVPFPNSELLLTVDEQGRRRVAIPEVEGSPIPSDLLPGINKLDGFSLRTPAAGGLPELGPVMLFSMQGEADIDTFGDAIVMYRLDETGAAQDEVALTVTSTNGVDIVVQPTAPLDPDTTYVVGVTRDLKQDGGADFASSTTFELLKTPVALTDSSTATIALQCVPLTQGGDMLAGPDEVAALAGALEPLRARWQPTFQALESQGIPRTDLLLAWTYTTQSVTDVVDDIKTRVFAGEFDPMGPLAVPTGISAVGSSTIAELIGVADNVCLPLCQAGELPGLDPADCTDGEGNTSPDVAANPLCQLVVNLVTGQLASAELFLMRTHGMTSGSPYESGTLDDDLVDDPAPVDVPVWLVLPDAPAPAGGYPVAVFQHGLTRTKEDGFQIANSLAMAGYATVMLDLPWHGERASDLATLVNVPGLGPSEVPCTEPFIDPADVTCTLNTDVCTGGCDGVRDSDGTGFLSANTSGARGNFRQATIDQLTLLHTLQVEGAPTGAFSEIDPTRVVYVGQSFGGITGANLLAYIDNDEIAIAVLNVAGGDLIALLLNSILAIPLYAQLNAAGVCDYNTPNDPTSGCQITPDFLAFLSVADWTLQSTDPIQTAGPVADRFGVDRILMQAAVPDLIVPNVSNEALAMSYGFPLDDDTGQYQTYDFSMLPQATMGFGCHGFLLAPTCGQCLADALCMTVGAQTQAVTWLATQGQTIADKVPDQVAGFSCTNPCGPN